MSTNSIVISAAVGAGVAAALTFVLLRKSKSEPFASSAEAAASKADVAKLEAQMAALARRRSLPLPSPRGLPTTPIIPVPQLTRAEQKKILITGGAGFVGSHLVDALMLQVQWARLRLSQVRVSSESNTAKHSLRLS